MSEEKKENELSLEQLMHKKEIDATAWRMLNIFRQFHVIEGGIASVNKYFITADDDVINSIQAQPGGKKLAEHIRNLKTKKTSMNSINRYLLPFGEDVLLDLQDANKDVYDKEADQPQEKKTDEEIKEAFADYKKTELKDIPELTEVHDDVTAADAAIKSEPIMNNVDNTSSTKEEKINTEKNIPQFKPLIPNNNRKTDTDDIQILVDLINKFNPSPDALEEFKESKIISEIGQQWQVVIAEMLDRSEISNKDGVVVKFQNLIMYDRAVAVWNEAQTIVDNPSSINKENLKERIEHFKEYLLMFGESGERIFNQINDIVNK